MFAHLDEPARQLPQSAPRLLCSPHEQDAVVFHDQHLRTECVPDQLPPRAAARTRRDAIDRGGWTAALVAEPTRLRTCTHAPTTPLIMARQVPGTGTLVRAESWIILAVPIDDSAVCVAAVAQQALPHAQAALTHVELVTRGLGALRHCQPTRWSKLHRLDQIGVHGSEHDLEQQPRERHDVLELRTLDDLLLDPLRDLRIAIRLPLQAQVDAPVFDDVDAPRPQQREQHVERRTSRIEDMRRVVDHEIQRLAAELVRDDPAKCRRVPLVDAVVRVDHVVVACRQSSKRALPFG